MDKWFKEKFRDSIAYAIKINKPLAKVKSKYQNIEIFNNELLGNVMVIDDYLMLTSFDNFFYHEMITHPVMQLHKNPKKILIIGGGDCGTLQQVLKYPIQSVYQVEIDKAVTDLAIEHFPELCTSNHDSRAHLIFADGVKWVQDQTEKDFDVIIVDSSEPEGPGQELFSASFYQNCKNILAKDGIIIHQSGSPLLQPEQGILVRKNLAPAFSHIKTITFPMPSYPSGLWSATIGANNPIKPKYRFPVQDLKYFNEQILTSCFANPEFLAKTIV